MARLRVYVAGAYSAPTVVDACYNIGRGLVLSARVLQAGFAPFIPWLDFLLIIVMAALGMHKPAVEDLYGYSMAWLEASDAVLVVPEGAETSKGTQAELARARELDIPVFRDLTVLTYWAREREEV